MRFKSKKGIALIICYLVIVVITILGSAFLARSIGDKRHAEREKSAIQAFYLAEAGVDYALSQIRASVDNGNIPAATLGGIGTYSTSWNKAAGQNQWNISASGSGAGLTRNIAVAVGKDPLPPDFYDNALYCCEDLNINGIAYSIDGDVTYAGNFTGDDCNITNPAPPANPTQDASIAPLTGLDFARLREESMAQGNVYDAVRLATDTLPGSFWFDQANNIPNIVYIEADLALNGNIGTIGGFLVVVGDVLTNPDDPHDTTINGNGFVEGCIYTTGEFVVNGGGATGLNVNGAVWAGGEVSLNGNVDIQENSEYLNAIKNISFDISSNFQILSWSEP